MIKNEKYYYDLSHPQKRIWYVDKINLNSPIHNIGGCLKMHGRIDIEKMKKVLNHIIKNNEGLRLRITEECGKTMQYICEFQEQNIEFLDFSYNKINNSDFKKWSEGLFKKNFDLNDNQLFYFAIYKISEEEYGVILKIHHILADGWSINLIQKQICKLYDSLTDNEDVNIDRCYSYLNFIEEEYEYLNSSKLKKDKEFWGKKFRGIAKEFLYKTTDSQEGKRKSFDIDCALSNDIKKFVEKKKCSLNTFFIAILLIYVYKTEHKEDIILGIPLYNRSGKKQKNTVGMFTSTLPFRFSLDIESNIENLLGKINKELKACFLHQRYPYDLLVGDLELNKIGYDSLFKIAVNYYNTKYSNVMDGKKVGLEEYYNANQSYSLQLTIKEWVDSNITLNFDYKISEYSDQEISRMYSCIINTIRDILKGKNVNVKNINLLSDKEKARKIYNFNSTNRFYPKKKVTELLEEQVIKKPDKVAVEYRGIGLTYKDLNSKANQLANYLLKNGVKKGTVVGIMLSHSIELVIGILGVLKAGGAYLPVDSSYPVERINYILRDSESFMIITNIKINDEIEFRGKLININKIDLSSFSKENLIGTSELNDLAYIIYTSGSTGKPKGVMVEHKGLTNYIWWANKMYFKNKNEVMALYSSISFDLTVTSLFTPIISGNMILVYDNDDTEFNLFKVLRENKSTILKVTPSHLTLLKDKDNRHSNIKTLIVGGEDLKASLAKEIYNSFGGKIEIYNEYGPTETVVGCMIYKYDEKIKSISVPIGHPADNVQVYILDQDLNVVPTGIIGELYVSGDGVARGYLNRGDLTCEKFIDNPFIRGRKMYKTGDMARYLDNGIVEYVGRSDNQFKIRGYRIEFGEIEKCLLDKEGIEEAVVTFKKDNLGNGVLNAYIISNKEVMDLELKGWLQKFLPRYMIPTNFIRINELPLTPNGKINYDLLPGYVVTKNKFVRYKNDVEKELIKIMEEVLAIENISLKDNYYQLGGDSIKAIQISSKLKNIGLGINVKDILNNDSIEEIALYIKEERYSNVISQEEHDGYIDKTPIVEWFFNECFFDENHYNQYVLLEYSKAFDITSIEKVANELIKHHDSLRINYDNRTKKLYYNNKYLKEYFPVKLVNSREYTEYKQTGNIEILFEKVRSDFNIHSSLLFNITAFNFEKNKQALLFTAHHLVVDGVSWRIILDDFFTLLNQLEENKEISLPAKTSSFGEWAYQLQEYRKNLLQEEIIKWNYILNKNFAYSVDFNKGKDSVKTSSVISYILDKNMTNDLIKSVTNIYNTEFNETLIIALILTINKLTKSKDIVIELESHGREDISKSIDISRTVGWFTSIYPAYFSIQHKEIENNIKSIKEQLRKMPDKGFNYGIFKFLNHQIKGMNKKYIRFNYIGDISNIISKNILDIENIEFGIDSFEENSLTALLDIMSVVVNKKLKISVAYSNCMFKKESVELFMSCYIEMLALILDSCRNKLSREFTPSDFDSIDISQEDLNTIFD